MFITKKKFEAAIRKAKDDAEFECFKREEEARTFRYIHERIDNLESIVMKELAKVEPCHCDSCTSNR